MKRNEGKEYQSVRPEDVSRRLARGDGALPATNLWKPQYIYGLHAPKGAIRYIGRTQDPAARLGRHVAYARPESKYPGTTQKDAWIRQLLHLGKRPLLCILEKIYPCAPWPRRDCAGGTLMSEAEAMYSLYVDEREGRWTLHALKLGWPLLGHSPEFRASIQQCSIDFLIEPLDSLRWLALADLAL